MKRIIENPELFEQLRGRSSKSFIVVGILVALALIASAIALWLG